MTAFAVSPPCGRTGGTPRGARRVPRPLRGAGVAGVHDGPPLEMLRYEELVWPLEAVPPTALCRSCGVASPRCRDGARRRAFAKAPSAGARRALVRPAAPDALGLCRAIFFATLLVASHPTWTAVIGRRCRRCSGCRPTCSRCCTGVASPAVLALLDAAWRASLLLACVGSCTRAASICAFVLGVYVLGLPQCFGKIDHWSGLLVLTLGVLALARSGDAWSLDALLRCRRREAASGTERRVPLADRGRTPAARAGLLRGRHREAAPGRPRMDVGREHARDPARAALRERPRAARARSARSPSPALCAVLAFATIAAEAGAPLALLEDRSPAS